jgi:rubredoxin
LKSFSNEAIKLAKIVVCPQCEAEFNKPLFESKRYGIGIALPGMGALKCPKCGYKGSSSEFAPHETREI